MLFSAVSATDLPVLVNAGFFRLAADRYYVPISMAVPGSAIPVPDEKDKDKIELDVLGLVQDEQGRPVGRIRQTMKLPAGSVGTLNSKQVLYQSVGHAAARPVLDQGRRPREHERPDGIVRGAGARSRAEAGAAQGQLGRPEHAGAGGEGEVQRATRSFGTASNWSRT